MMRSRSSGANTIRTRSMCSRRKRPSKTQILVPAALAVPVVALAALFVPAHSSVGSKQTELDSLKAELATLPAPTAAGIDQNIKGEQARRKLLLAALEKIEIGDHRRTYTLEKTRHLHLEVLLGLNVIRNARIFRTYPIKQCRVDVVTEPEREDPYIQFFFVLEI